MKLSSPFVHIGANAPRIKGVYRSCWPHGVYVGEASFPDPHTGFMSQQWCLMHSDKPFAIYLCKMPDDLDADDWEELLA